MSVDIQIMYETPPDFDLPSPPYYRPASSVILTCVVHGASGSVQYRWSFYNSQTYDSWINQWYSITRTHTRLTASNAGLYTCTVTDEDGSAVSASTEMIIVGKNIYVHFVPVVYSRILPTRYGNICSREC